MRGNAIITDKTTTRKSKRRRDGIQICQIARGSRDNPSGASPDRQVHNISNTKTKSQLCNKSIARATTNKTGESTWCASPRYVGERIPERLKSLVHALGTPSGDITSCSLSLPLQRRQAQVTLEGMDDSMMRMPERTNFPCVCIGEMKLLRVPLSAMFATPGASNNCCRARGGRLQTLNQHSSRRNKGVKLSDKYVHGGNNSSRKLQHTWQVQQKKESKRFSVAIYCSKIFQ